MIQSRLRMMVLLLASCFAGSVFAAPTATISIVGSERPVSGGWDTGAITISFNGFSETATYGQFSTPDSIAAQLAAKFAQDPISALPRLCTLGVCAKAHGSAIVFELASAGPYTSLSTSVSGSSFTVDGSTWPLQPRLLTPSLDVTCSPNPVVLGSTIICNALMPASATGTVAFSLDAGSPWSPATLASGNATASTSLPGVAAGDHYVTASYSGDGQFIPVKEIFHLSVIASGLTQVSLYSFSMSAIGDLEPNGNIRHYTDSVNGTWDLTYDTLNRLATADMTDPIGSAQHFCWSYDAFGNRLVQATSSQAFTGSSGYPTCQTGTPGPSPPHQATYSAKNQFTSVDALPALSVNSYDAAGNLRYTADMLHLLLYDAEGRTCGFVTAPLSGGRQLIQYIYDAEGRRVAKGTKVLSSNETPACGPASSLTVTNVYVTDQAGVIVTEMDGSGTWMHTNVSAGGQFIATYANDSLGVHFHLTDWLGTRRVQANYLGIAETSFTNLPYGEAPPVTSDVTEQHFTGKERDTESGLDYFGSRYYGSSMGRFMSPDPSGLLYSDPNDPQSLNLYSYVRNNPLKNIDPTGLDCVYLNDEGTGVEAGGIDHDTSEGECNVNGGYYAPGHVSDASSVHIGSGDQIGISSSVNGQGVFSIVNCSGCSTKNSDGSLMGAMTQTFGNLSPADNLFITGYSFLHPGPRPLDKVDRWPPLLTQSQIYNYCAIAVSLRAGGTVPGDTGTASSLPSTMGAGGTDADNTMPVPSNKAQFARLSPEPTASAPMNANAAKLDTPVAMLALAGSVGECVKAVTAANR